MTITKITGLPRVVFITNIPSPYRIPIFQKLSKHWGEEKFKVFFCANKEPNRNWDIHLNGFTFTYLKGHCLKWKGSYIHFNIEILKKLNDFKPDIIISTSFNPTFLFAFLYAKFYKKSFIPMTDGTLDSEKKLTFVHRKIRQIVFKNSKAFIGTSQGSFDLYNSYSINKDEIFRSHLCANNQAFSADLKLTKRSYDLMFSGRFSKEKNPQFAIEVAVGLAKILGRKITLLMLGDGPLFEQIKLYAFNVTNVVEVIFKGFIQQDALPHYYCDAKIFLFPSSWDPWGVVANEACAAGQAVLISPYAGAANDLIIDNKNGYVLDLILELWVEKAATLLNNNNLLTQFSKESLSRVQSYNYDVASEGIIHAVASLSGVSNKPKRVVIIQRRLTHYRVLFYELLRETLAQQNIKLDLLVGLGRLKEQSKQDDGYIPWAKSIATFYFFNDRLCLQFFNGYLSGADLVVIVQENALLNNLLLLLLPLRSFKLAFWGHGANLQSKKPNGLLERFKKWTTKKVDWWFAYTQLSYDLIKQQSFNPDNITILNNAINTEKLQQLTQAVTASDKQILRESLNFGAGKVGVFIGSLYANKRLDFLFSAAELIHHSLPDFNLLIIGTGPECNKVQDFCATNDWAKWVGFKAENEKAAYLSLAQMILNPGLVGLNILDSFSCGLPMLTTNCGIHSPEISYLQNDSNGVITADDVTIYSNKAIQLLENPEHLERLRLGCLASAKVYTLENMVKNFADGVVKCLANYPSK